MTADSAGSVSGVSDSSGSDSSKSDSSQSRSGSNPSQSSDDGGEAGSWGYIAVKYGEYVPGTIDWDPGAESVTVESGPATCPKYDILKKAFEDIAASKTPYNPLGPNSNSCVFTALKKAGITPQEPNNVWVPGADVPIQ